MKTILFALSVALATTLLAGMALQAAPPAPPVKKAAPAPWRVTWRWDSVPEGPVLVLFVSNPGKEPLALAQWEVVGTDAAQFVPDRSAPAMPSEMPPGGVVELRLAYHRAPEVKKLSATLRLTGERLGREVSQKFDLARPVESIPYRYRDERLAARIGKPVPRDARGRLIVNDGYHDDAMVASLLAASAKDYPRIAQLETLGTTCQGRAILGLRITSPARPDRDKPAFLFVGAHHGNELLSTEFVLDIIEQLTRGYAEDPAVRDWVNRYEIWCVPLANPDGCHAFVHETGAGRKNGRDTDGNGRLDYYDGVDLNRNYPFRWHSLGEQGSSSSPLHGRFRGPSAGSEPETKALMRLANRERFVMLVSFHTAGTRVLVPYTIDGARNPHPDAAWIVGAIMAALCDPARPDRDYMPVRKLYSVDGVDQDWHYWRHGTLAFLLEGPQTNPPYATHRDRMVAGIRPGWRYLLGRLAAGPTLSGHVLDARTGRPLEAVVSIDEIQTFEKEVHTSHPETGRFDRVLPIEGTYHLHVQCQGYQPAVLEVPVGREWRHVQVRLTPTG